MKKILFAIILFSSLIVCSCSSRNDKIIGYWEATFADSSQNPIQYFDFKVTQNALRLTMDEPMEDWYNIPGEKVYFQNDSLYFERFWGLEKYYGKFSSADFVFHGFKQVANKAAIPFTMQKTNLKALIYKIPRVDIHGKRISSYQYSQPVNHAEHFDCSDLADAGIDSTLIIRLVNKILRQEIPNIHSLLMMKDNKLILEEYFYDYSPNRLHRVHSVTKSFTSALLGIAIDRNFIAATNEPVRKYFSERNTTKWVNDRYDIQIAHLLSMSAGLDWKGLTLGESNDDIDMYKSTDYFGYLLNKGLKYQPGTNFCYNNGLSLMLGHVIEKSTGLPLDSFARESLFKPLAINHYSWDADDNGIVRTDGGLKLRPRDMLSFGQLYINGGKFQHNQLISENWIHQSTEPKIRSTDQEYAYHWWVKSYSVNSSLFRTFYALGHGEQAIVLVPEQKLIFVMTAGNYLQPEHRPFEILKDYILPSIQVGLKTKQDTNLEKFVGQFEINADESITVEKINNSLIAKDPSGARLPLVPKSSSHFMIEHTPREVYFITDEQGIIVAAEVYVNGLRTDHFKKR
jgi:CubicO group peptidase (beta-lactamase class C family)